MLALLLLISGASATIVGDLNCTTYIGQGTVTFGYSPSATVCSNTISDAACDIIFPPVVAGKYPAPGNDVERPFNCYTITKASGGAFSADMKTAALNICPKSCGYCCQTNSYNCRNVQFLSPGELSSLKTAHPPIDSVAKEDASTLYPIAPTISPSATLSDYKTL
ncbi:hypothetical protein B9Z55_017356 [Caenorhabditis nigoni]|nr:hypothetical protein B9Z55_017356 [Caenorhabditis nigoni]